MADTRSDAAALFRTLEFSSWYALGKILVCLVIAVGVAIFPEYPGLDLAPRRALFILVLAAGLWITEAIPAFAVGLLVIGLEISLLGRPGGVFAQDGDDWERFIAVWGSPLIWLFFGGFVLAAAAEKTGLTNWLASNFIRRLGSRPAWQLLGIMAATFVFSMFISNTATATMMVAVLTPLLNSISNSDRLRKGLLLGIAFAANLGGMATVIGSPPNAIAAGALRSVDRIDFAGWMVAGLPPAVVLLGVAWLFLVFRYPSKAGRFDLAALGITPETPLAPLWQRLAVILVFVCTVGLWLTSSLSGLPATVISFVPICALTAIGVLNSADIRTIPWDVLLLIAGGLALGVAVTDTGLAAWLVDQVPQEGLTAFALAMALSYLTAILSNVMSNTAATNILVPIAMVASVGFEMPTVVPIALGASAGMCLPISTPPNAIAYGTGELEVRDMLLGGILLGAIAPGVATAWCWLVL